LAVDRVLERSKNRNEELTHHLEVNKAVQYLQEREKKEGGFSFVPELYPDIEDTYYATRVLKLLNVNVDRDKTANYLKNIDWKEVGFPRAVYMLLSLSIYLWELSSLAN
jgi:hypothetical protein